MAFRGLSVFTRKSLLLHKKRPYSEFVWSVFSRIRTEYGGLLCKIYIIFTQNFLWKTPNTDIFYAVCLHAFEMLLLRNVQKIDTLIYCISTIWVSLILSYLHASK